MRSMQVQASDLQKAGMAIADLKLTRRPSTVGRYLAEIEPRGAPYDKDCCSSAPARCWPTCPRTRTRRPPRA